MAKGDYTPPPTTTTTVQKPPEEAQKLLKLADPYAEQFAANPPKLPDYSLIAPFDPLQTQGQEQVLAGTGAQQNIANAAAGGSQFLNSGAALDPRTNPALQATIEAGQRPLYENLMESILPKLRGNAINTGNWGGSRQGIMEGQAIGRTQQAAGDVGAKIANAGYLGGLEAMGKGQQYAGQIGELQSLPGVTTSGVGDVRQALAQSLLGEQGQRFSYEQTLPLLMAKELYGMSAGIPGGSATSTMTQPEQNRYMQIAGLGVQGLGSAAKLMPSDRRLKQDIQRIGTAGSTDIGVYLFRFKGMSDLKMGFMADEVERVLPEAVGETNGVKHVDYGMVYQYILDQGESVDV